MSGVKEITRTPTRQNVISQITFKWYSVRKYPESDHEPLLVTSHIIDKHSKSH